MKVRLKPELVDQARNNLGVTSDEKLAAQLELTRNTLDNVRRGKGVSLGTAVLLMNAANITDIRLATYRVAEPAA